MSQVPIILVSNFAYVQFEISEGAKVHYWSENMVRQQGRENYNPMKRLGSSYGVLFAVGLSGFSEIEDEVDYKE